MKFALKKTDQPLIATLEIRGNDGEIWIRIGEYNVVKISANGIYRFLNVGEELGFPLDEHRRVKETTRA